MSDFVWDVEHVLYCINPQSAHALQIETKAEADTLNCAQTHLQMLLTSLSFVQHDKASYLARKH